jgi:hypothetical protein
MSIPVFPQITDRSGQTMDAAKRLQVTVEDYPLSTHNSGPASRLLEKGPQSKPSNTRSLRLSDVLNTWKLETGSLLLSVLGLVGLFFLLKAFDGQRQTDWNLQYLTRNTTLAIVSTLIRMSLMYSVSSCLGQGKWTWFSEDSMRPKIHTNKVKDMKGFDDASRGFLGSLTLLPSIILHRHQIFSVLGAVLTILAITFDPFAQNILAVRYQDVGYAGGSLKSIAVRQRYNLSYRDEQLLDVADSSTDPELDLHMKSAIIAGTIGIPSLAITEPCPTGNCTWPVTPTFAVCGACTDVTNNLTWSGMDASGRRNYTLPDGVTINTWDRDTQLDDTSVESSVEIFVASTSGGDVYQYFKNGDVESSRMYPAQFSVIQGRAPRYNLTQMRATECALWYCIKEYNVSTSLGQQRETIVRTWDANETNIVTPQRDLYAESSTDAEQKFGISMDNAYGIQMKLEQRLGGTAWAEPTGKLEFETDSAHSMFASHDNLTGWVNNLADSITNAMRTQGDTVPVSLEEYRGTAFSTEAFIHVRWIWIAFPCAMVMGGIVNLAGTIWQTDRANVLAWRSDPLAPLLMTLSRDTDAEGKEDEAIFIRKNGAVQESIRNRRVHLRKDVQGLWKFE